MTEIMTTVRQVMGNEMTPTPINDIFKKMKKMNTLHQNISTEELMDILRHYASLNVLHIDESNCVMFI